MAKIYVDHLVIAKTAGKIENYVSSHNKKINQIDTVVGSMQWKGVDYEQTKREWETIKGKGSTSDKLVNAFSDYRRSLLYAANEYKEAQARAIDRAGRLCK